MSTDPRYPIGRFAPPVEYSSAVHASCLADLAAAPALVREAVLGLDPAQMLTPYRDGGWTPAQVVHHLVDSHLNAYVRLKLALTEDNPVIRPYREAAWADLPDASDPDVETSLQIFSGLHARWVAACRRLEPSDFVRPMVHPERGAQSVERMLALYAWHGKHHAAQITVLRAQRRW
jgi:hypothetical protein